MAFVGPVYKEMTRLLRWLGEARPDWALCRFEAHPRIATDDVAIVCLSCQTDLARYTNRSAKIMVEQSGSQAVYLWNSLRETVANHYKYLEEAFNEG